MASESNFKILCSDSSFFLTLKNGKPQRSFPVPQCVVKQIMSHGTCRHGLECSQRGRMNRQVFFGEAKSGPNITLSIGDLDLITLIKVSVICL